MTLEQVKNQVAEIVANVNDDEAAHCMEDDLRAEFIRFVARRPDDLGLMARTILQTDELKFARWYA